LAVNGVFAAIDFKEGVFAVAVDFIAWGVLAWTFELNVR
jgi:hypothetical protein